MVWSMLDFVATWKESQSRCCQVPITLNNHYPNTYYQLSSITWAGRRKEMLIQKNSDEKVEIKASFQ